MLFVCNITFLAGELFLDAFLPSASLEFLCGLSLDMLRIKT